jgi:hypothetical protein
MGLWQRPPAFHDGKNQCQLRHHAIQGSSGTGKTGARAQPKPQPRTTAHRAPAAVPLLLAPTTLKSKPSSFLLPPEQQQETGIPHPYPAMVDAGQAAKRGKATDEKGQPSAAARTPRQHTPDHPPYCWVIPYSPRIR